MITTDLFIITFGTKGFREIMQKTKTNTNQKKQTKKPII